MSTPGSDQGLIAEWRDLSARHARVNDALEKELQAKHGLSVSEFEALQRIAETAEDGCRLQRLVDDVHMSQSALSRLVSRLEERGLVHRASCPEDRRGMKACLTSDGRDRLAEATPTHSGVLRRVLAG